MHIYIPTDICINLYHLITFSVYQLKRKEKNKVSTYLSVIHDYKGIKKALFVLLMSRRKKLDLIPRTVNMHKGGSTPEFTRNLSEDIIYFLFNFPPGI